MHQDKLDAKKNQSASTLGALPDATAKQLSLIETQLQDNKAVDVQLINVRERSSIADILVIASGNSSRHVKAMAEYLTQMLKTKGQPALGVEGEKDGEWVLVDAGDIIVHLMLPQIREFYNLESLWDEPRSRDIDIFKASE